jgi:hypothetical protein
MSEHGARAALALAVALTLTPGLAMGQTSDQDEMAAIKAEMARLSARMEALERRRAGEAGPTPTASAAAPPVEAPPPPAEVEPTSLYARGVPVAPVSSFAARGAGRAVAVLPAPNDRALQDAASVVQVSAGKDSTRVSLKLSSEISEPKVSGPAGSEGWGSTTQRVLTVSGALDKKGDSTDLFTLDELNSDLDVKLQWSRRLTRLRLATAADVAPLRVAAIDACKTELVKVKKQDDCEKDYKKRGSGFIADWLGSASEDAYLAQMAPEGAGYAYGLEGHVGRKVHNFIDPTLVAMDKDKHTPWGVKAFGSVLPARTLSTWTASVEYQQDYKDGSSKILCPTAVSGVSTTCLNAPVGAPEDKEKLLVGLEWRSLVPISKKGPIQNLGVSAQLLYDERSDDWGVDVPIYFATDEKGKLIGGVRLGYKSDDDDFKIGVFVGAPFANP